MDPENQNGNDFDAELDAILNGSGEPSEATSAPLKPQTTKPVESSKLKAGGREWDSPDALGKAYDALLKDYSRKGDALKKGEQFIKWGEAVSKHQELRAQIEKSIQEFNARAKGGATPQGNQPYGQLPPEVQQRLQRVEDFMAEREVDQEIAQLKSRYKIEPSELKAVMNRAIELGNEGKHYPLDTIYRDMHFDAMLEKAKAEGEKAGIQKLTQKRGANVGSSSNPSVAPTAKPVGELKGKDYDEAILAQLGQLGYSD